MMKMMIWEFKGEETVESNYESAQTKPTCGHLSHFQFMLAKKAVMAMMMVMVVSQQLLLQIKGSKFVVHALWLSGVE